MIQTALLYFPTKSWDYMHGYRDSVVKASQDVQKFNDGKLDGIDARQDHIPCSSPYNNIADYCEGFHDGYSDEAMDQLE